MVQSQPEQLVCKALAWKKTHHQKRTGGMSQGVVGLEFKPQYRKKKKKNPVLISDSSVIHFFLSSI
jgi:hypothetical protein